jgi:hypothetical protein
LLTNWWFLTEIHCCVLQLREISWTFQCVGTNSLCFCIIQFFVCQFVCDIIRGWFLLYCLGRKINSLQITAHSLDTIKKGWEQMLWIVSVLVAATPILQIHKIAGLTRLSLSRPNNNFPFE